MSTPNKWQWHPIATCPRGEEVWLLDNQSLSEMEKNRKPFRGVRENNEDYQMFVSEEWPGEFLMGFDSRLIEPSYSLRSHRHAPPSPTHWAEIAEIKEPELPELPSQDTTDLLALSMHPLLPIRNTLERHHELIGSLRKRVDDLENLEEPTNPNERNPEE